MRVLLAEDDSRISQFVQEVLEKNSYAVDVVQDGEKALRLGSSESYDVILMDVMMPSMDGISVCRSLRDQGVKAPIIMISGKSEIDDRITGLDSGADDYLTKPFSVRELLARIRAHVRRRDSSPVRQIEVSGLMVDLDKRMAYREGKQLMLSPKEYRILEYFVLNDGKSLTRYDILENVWGQGISMFSNVVDVHISNLRQKLNQGFDKPLIKTVRGGGYTLD